MQGRFSRVFGIEKNLYLTGSPVLIAAGALLQNNENGKKIAQLKIQNISAHTIKEVHVAFRLYAANGDVLEQKETFAYLQLNIERDAFFGEQTPIYFSVPGVSSFSVWVESVVFKENGTRPAWKASEAEWSALQPQKMLEETDFSSAARLQYKREFKNGSFIMQSERDLWQCACGSINRQEESSCHKCQVKREDLQSVDSNALEENAKKIEKEENKKNIRNVIIFLLCILIVVGSIVYINYSKEMKPYWEAEKLLESGDVISAFEKFRELDGFKDSEERAKEAYISYLLVHRLVDLEFPQEFYREQRGSFERITKKEKIVRAISNKKWFELHFDASIARELKFAKNGTGEAQKYGGEKTNLTWSIEIKNDLSYGDTLSYTTEAGTTERYYVYRVDDELLVLYEAKARKATLLLELQGKWHKRLLKSYDFYDVE